MTTPPAPNSDLAARVAAARAHLDAHVRDLMAWHFDPDTGAPFWLERARDLDFDPRTDVRGMGDLRLFGFFDGDWLRGGPVRRFLPRGFRGRPFRIFETGGTTGTPKSRVAIRDFETDYELFGDGLDDTTFPRGSDWLMLGPTGPRRLRLAIEHLAHYRGGAAFHVDCDPRWVNRLIRDDRLDVLEAYKQHVVEQGLVVLRSHEIRCLFTTPKLLEGLAAHGPLGRLGITGIFCGGTEISPEFHRRVRRELAPGVDFVPVYGNTLMGLASPKRFAAGSDDYTISYYPPWPRGVFEIVDPDEPERLVELGATGRVRLSTLTREFFMPWMLERDQGTRVGPDERFAWDGVSDLRPFNRHDSLSGSAENNPP